MKTMVGLLLGLLVFSAGAFAQEQSQADLFKKEIGPLQASIDEVVSSVIPAPAGLLGKTKATYLDGYGTVVMLEVMLESSRNPFAGQKTPAEVRAIVAQRRKALKDKLETFLKDRVARLQSLTESDSLTIVVQLFNSNPADIPDLPSQLLFTIKKQDVTQVAARELK